MKPTDRITENRTDPSLEQLDQSLETVSAAWRIESAGERASRQARLRHRLRAELSRSGEPPFWRLAVVSSVAGVGGLVLGFVLARPPEPSLEQWFEEWDELAEYVELAAVGDGEQP